MAVVTGSFSSSPISAPPTGEREPGTTTTLRTAAGSAFGAWPATAGDVHVPLGAPDRAVGGSPPGEGLRSSRGVGFGARWRLPYRPEEFGVAVGAVPVPFG